MRLSTPASAQKYSPLHNVGRLLVSWSFLRWAAPAYMALMLVVWAVLIGQWLGGSNGRDARGVVLGPDFPAFFTGGWLVRQGENASLYDLQRQQAIQQTVLGHEVVSAYVNPPHYALFAAPFSALSYAQAFALWSVLMLLAFGVSVALLRLMLPRLREPNGLLLGGLALLSAPVYFALSAGQNTGLSLLLHVGILLALVRRRDGVAGVLIALGMFKPQLFIGLLPLLLIDRRWRSLAAFTISAALLGVVTVWLFGWRVLVDWLALLQSPLYRYEEVRQAAKMFSWQPLWQLALGPNMVATVLGWLSALIVFAGLCRLWWRGVAALPLRYAVTLCGLMVMSPHLPVYDLGLLILPGLVIADRLLRLPVTARLGLRMSLLTLYVLLLFAISVDRVWVFLIVPLITAIAANAAQLDDSAKIVQPA